MPNLGPTEIIVIALLIILLFGFKKLPDAARSVGRSMRVFRSEMDEMKHEKDGQPTTVHGEVRDAGRPVTETTTTRTDGEGVVRETYRTDGTSAVRETVRREDDGTTTPRV